MSYITNLTNEFSEAIEALAANGYTFTFKPSEVLGGEYRVEAMAIATNGILKVTLELNGCMSIYTVDGDIVFMGDLIGPSDETGAYAELIALISETPKSPEFNAGVAASKEENTAIRNNPHRSSADLEKKLEWAAGWLFGYDGLEGRTGYLAARVAAYATHTPNYINGWSPVVECRTNKQIASMLNDEMTIEEAIAFIADEVGV